MDAAYTGKQIVEHRKALGMTQRDLAEKLHITDKAVSKWERGINYPDLGLMESLARELKTTPAQLLGLENAEQDEIVTSITQISNEQKESAHRDVRQAGWIQFGSAILLILAYILFGKDVRKTQLAYQLLHGVILLLVIYSVYILIKFGEIRKWSTADWGIAYGFGIPILIFLGIQLFTGHNPSPILEWILIVIPAICIQLLFCRVMRPKIIQSLPAIIICVYAAWQLWLGASLILPLSAAISALFVLLLYRHIH